MAIENSSGISLIPAERPPERYLQSIPFYIRQVIANYSPQSQRAVEWTIALSIELEREWLTYPFYPLRFARPQFAYGYLDQRFPTYGFLDPDNEVDKFGVIIHYIKFSRPDDFIERSIEDRPLTIGSRQFPVFHRMSVLEQHSALLHPRAGTGTCMARPKNSRSRQLSLVTAEHVVRGLDKIDVVDGSNTFIEQGTVDKVASAGVDAATIIVSSGKTGARLQSVDPIAQWSDVSLMLRGQPINGKVVSVTDMRGSLSSSIPGRVFTTVHGKGGDSGSSLIDQHNKTNLMGIYIGAIKSQGGAMEGISQHAAQAEQDLAVRLYEGA